MTLPEIHPRFGLQLLLGQIGCSSPLPTPRDSLSPSMFSITRFSGETSCPSMCPSWNSYRAKQTWDLCALPESHFLSCLQLFLGQIGYFRPPSTPRESLSPRRSVITRFTDENCHPNTCTSPHRAKQMRDLPNLPEYIFLLVCNSSWGRSGTLATLPHLETTPLSGGLL